ncbi:MAG TPA: glycosyltransferase family 2 protein [Candidatus Limnocylindria bacterium]|nr:glycosyltransferase family 2 protein [Candidatus Limnocylindria bacterium]
MTLLFLGTAAVFLAMTLSTLWHLRWVRRLPGRDTLPPSNGKVRCSVVIAARDEEARIEQTIRHLLAQCEVDAEFIVVDDRSKDRTSEILRRLAREHPRIQVKRVDVLPEGWLGKCHACHVGASAATGDWILFTDADCWLKLDVIARALSLAERDGVDHVTLASGLSSTSPGLQASHLVFLMGTANWFSGANRDGGKRHLGFGAFNLVRTTAYRQCGGYEALRLTVLDDVKLGLLMQRAGRRTRAFIGGEDAECHWGTNALSIIKIMEKNYFAALEYRTSLVLAGSMFVVLLSTILILGLLSGTIAGLAAALSPLSLIVPGVILARRLNWSWPCAALIPFMFPIFHYALLNSTFATLRQGGIRWRETFYPLETLRAGNVR